VKDDQAALLGVDEKARKGLETWLALLSEWNKRIDLTAARTDEELLDLMLADALVLSRAEHIPQDARVVDVGTGAGSPGLALAILRPDLKVTLVEPLAKRISFMRTVLGTLGRTDITLLRERVEDLIPEKGQTSPPSHDVAISRATLAPHVWVPIGLELAPSAWALLAREEPPTVQGARVTVDFRYDWPLTQVGRRAIRYDKIA
jgi:16S rRNA (guanine527-N7)-methyltransferase